MARLKQHGLCSSPEYSSWKCMVSRVKRHERYISRKISIIERWRDFKNFYEDMGKKPAKNYTLERVDNSKGYYPENCIWANRKEQSRNRGDYNVKILYNGKLLLLCELAEEVNLHQKLLRTRLFGKNPMPVEKAVMHWDFKSNKPLISNHN